MENKQFENILQKILETRETKESQILKWVAGVISGILVVLVTSGFIWGVSGITDNENRISILESQTDTIKKQNEKVIRVVEELALNFSKFSSQERYTVSNSKDDFNNFYQNRISPLKEDIQQLKIEQNRMQFIDEKYELHEEKIKRIELVLDNIQKH